jgi:hypothetical protein
VLTPPPRKVIAALGPSLDDAAKRMLGHQLTHVLPH